MRVELIESNGVNPVAKAAGWKPVDTHFATVHVQQTATLDENRCHIIGVVTEAGQAMKTFQRWGIAPQVHPGIQTKNFEGRDYANVFNGRLRIDGTDYSEAWVSFGPATEIRLLVSL